MSLVGIGRTESGHALHGLGQAAQMEERRNAANRRLERRAEAAHTQNVASMTGTGAAAGAMAGAEEGSIGGPYGALVGAAAGFLAGELFG
jgi:uncharacterized membrane protein